MYRLDQQFRPELQHLKALSITTFNGKMDFKLVPKSFGGCNFSDKRSISDIPYQPTTRMP